MLDNTKTTETMQTIEAIMHLKKKFGMSASRIPITDYDRKSLNRIIEHYNATSKQNSANQVMFKKLFINEFLRQAVFFNKGTRVALTNIESILRVPLEEFYQVLSEESQFKKMQNRLKEIEYIQEEDLSNDMVEKALQKEKNNQILDANMEDLRRDLLDSFSPEQAKRFLEQHLNEIILTYKDFA